MSNLKCPACHEEIGTEVKPGRFVGHVILGPAGVCQLCKSCTNMLPREVILDLQLRPQHFADNARKYKRYDRSGNFKKLIEFGMDRARMIVNTKPGIEIVQTRGGED